jgi:hypothetical protein
MHEILRLSSVAASLTQKRWTRHVSMNNDEHPCSNLNHGQILSHDFKMLTETKKREVTELDTIE